MGTTPLPGWESVGQASQQSTLAGLEDVGRLQGDPEALEVGGLLLAVVVFLTLAQRSGMDSASSKWKT